MLSAACTTENLIAKLGRPVAVRSNRRQSNAARDGLRHPDLVPFSQRFRYVTRLGKGTQGVAYLCRDLRETGRRVVVKVARREPEAQKMIEREAEILRTLRGSPTVPKLCSLLYRDGLISGFVTRYIAGETLDRHLRRRRLSNSHVRSLAVSTIDALQDILGRDVLHRDIKPENLLVGRSRKVHILDFGLACKFTELPDLGELSGTFAYASPEQLKAKPVYPGSDLFSLGLILYEVATGQRFFSRNLHDFPAFMAYRERRLRETVHLESVETRLANLIRRLLVLDPRRRAGLRELEARADGLRRD